MFSEFSFASGASYNNSKGIYTAEDSKNITTQVGNISKIHSQPCKGECHPGLNTNGNEACAELPDAWLCGEACQKLSDPCQGLCHNPTWKMNCDGDCALNQTNYRCLDQCLPIGIPCNATCEEGAFYNCQEECEEFDFTKYGTWFCNGNCIHLNEPCNGKCAVNFLMLENGMCRYADNISALLAEACPRPETPCHGVCLNQTFLTCDGKCVESINSNLGRWQCQGECQSWEKPCFGRCHSPYWIPKCSGVCEPWHVQTVYECNNECVAFDIPCNGKCSDELTG